MRPHVQICYKYNTGFSNWTTPVEADICTNKFVSSRKMSVPNDKPALVPKEEKIAPDPKEQKSSSVSEEQRVLFAAEEEKAWEYYRARREYHTMDYVKMTSRATTPERGTECSAAFDLFSAEALEIPPKERRLVSTDLGLRVPKGTYGRIASKSSLSFFHGIEVGAGVVDPDFTGSVRVMLYNHGTAPFPIKQKMKIAQLICEKISKPVLINAKELRETLRGAGGFGSTGKKGIKTCNAIQTKYLISFSTD